MIPIIPLIFYINFLGIHKLDTDPLTRVNQYRIENGLDPVKFNNNLAKSSMNKACDLRDKNYWSHRNPDGKLWEFIIEAGYQYRIAGEDLARDCVDVECVDLWMKSPKHREVILTKNYKDGAVSRCDNYLVLHMGTKMGVADHATIAVNKIRYNLLSYLKDNYGEN